MKFVDQERATILKTDKQWAAAAAEGKDVDRIISFWADDAKIFAPGMPLIEGKAGIRQFVENSLATPGFSIRWTTSEVVVSDDGSLAYATGTNEITFHDPQGKSVAMSGKAVTVWRKDSSGAWKCMIDIWNDVPQDAQ